MDGGATAEGRYSRQAVSESRMFLAKREKARGGLTCMFDTTHPRPRVDYVLVTSAGIRLTLNLLAPTTVGARINP